MLKALTIRQPPCYYIDSPKDVNNSITSYNRYTIINMINATVKE